MAAQLSAKENEPVQGELLFVRNWLQRMDGYHNGKDRAVILGMMARSLFHPGFTDTPFL